MHVSEASGHKPQLERTELWKGPNLVKENTQISQLLLPLIITVEIKTKNPNSYEENSYPTVRIVRFLLQLWGGRGGLQAGWSLNICPQFIQSLEMEPRPGVVLIRYPSLQMFEGHPSR